MRETEKEIAEDGEKISENNYWRILQRENWLKLPKKVSQHWRNN